MTWLTPAPALGLVFPDGLAPVEPPVTLLPTTAVTVRDDGEPLVPIEGALATLPLYARLPVPFRFDGLLLRATVLERLVRADAALPQGWTICVIDAWRPLAFQRALLAHYAQSHPGSLDGYVADPDAAVAPPHTTGGTADLTLAWHGTPLGLGTDFDDFSPAAAPAALEGGDADLSGRLGRRLLSQVLRGVGFVVNPYEWWHWEVGTQYWGQVTGTPLIPFGLVGEPAT